MKTIHALAVALALNSTGIYAAEPESVAVKEMAAILIDFDHNPTSSGKMTLQNIAKDPATSAHEKTIATALLNVEHKATGSDKTRLKGIIDDPSASPQTKELAGIIYNLNHHPTASEKKSLSMLLGK
ncbi:MAG: hypothetical protein HY272_04985 [Gammaproteobacteria bacterium]|nr:hypothetical protein [Gammaproteobacteria bacterium]